MGGPNWLGCWLRGSGPKEVIAVSPLLPPFSQETLTPSRVRGESETIPKRNSKQRKELGRSISFCAYTA